MTKTTLEQLKKQYAQLQRKYKLPSFDQLNKEFDIEKLQESETEFLLRGIRRAVTEKILSVLRLLEFFLNPSAAQGAPLFVFSLLKTIKSSTKKTMEKIYRELAASELAAIDLDLDYNESKEAAFIKNTIKSWQDLKDELKEISKELGVAWTVVGKEEEKGYLG